MRLNGLHHVSSITGDAKYNVDFHTRLLGMRLVKKTVNQDDVSAYHLFYADALANPGSDLTFFDWAVPREERGSRSVSRTALRVAGEGALGFWRDRLKQKGASIGEVAEIDGRLTLPFEDFEGQRLALIDDGGNGAASPWERSPVPLDKQIRGL